MTIDPFAGTLIVLGITSLAWVAYWHPVEYPALANAVAGASIFGILALIVYDSGVSAGYIDAKGKMSDPMMSLKMPLWSDASFGPLWFVVFVGFLLLSNALRYLPAYNIVEGKRRSPDK